MPASHHSPSRLANYESGVLPPPDLRRSYFSSRRPRSMLKGHRRVMALKSLRFGRCYRTWRNTLAHCKKAYLAKTSELRSDSRARLKSIETKTRRSTRGSSFLWRNILLPPCTLEQLSGIATLALPIVYCGKIFSFNPGVAISLGRFFVTRTTAFTRRSYLHHHQRRRRRHRHRNTYFPVRSLLSCSYGKSRQQV